MPERESASHPAQLTNARVGGLPEPLGLHRRLPEEEKHLIVIGVLALRDPEGPNELWFWKEQEAAVRLYVERWVSHVNGCTQPRTDR